MDGETAVLAAIIFGFIIYAFRAGFSKSVKPERGGGCPRLPRMMGFQAAGSAPLVLGHTVEQPDTIATAIRIGNPASWKGATDAVRESDGRIDKVTDEEILEAYKLVARTEGVFVEPACAAPLAGLIRCTREGVLPEGCTIAATMTGHGLKDPDTAIQQSGGGVITVDAALDPVKEAILGNLS